jgi:hypothetical protein
MEAGTGLDGVSALLCINECRSTTCLTKIFSQRRCITQSHLYPEGQEKDLTEAQQNVLEAGEASHDNKK